MYENRAFDTLHCQDSLYSPRLRDNRNEHAKPNKDYDTAELTSVQVKQREREFCAEKLGGMPKEA